VLRKIWIVLGGVVLIIPAYVTALAIEGVERPLVEEQDAGGTVEVITSTVCTSGCDFTSLQAAVDAANEW
jgi:hypothetical protein